MSYRILASFLVAVLGIAAGSITASAQNSALPLIPNVCEKNNKFAHAVVVIAFTKSGRVQGYLCNKNYAPGDPGKPESQDTLPTGFGPIPGTMGQIEHQKLAPPASADPCIWIYSGGRKTYICW